MGFPVRPHDPANGRRRSSSLPWESALSFGVGSSAASAERGRHHPPSHPRDRQTDRRAHARAHALPHPAPSSPRPRGMRARGDCGPRPAVRGQRARRRLGLGGSLSLAGPSREQPVSPGLPGSYLAGAAAAPGPGPASLAGSARGRRYRAKLRGARPVRPHEPPGTSGCGRRWSHGGEWAGPGRGLTPPPRPLRAVGGLGDPEDTGSPREVRTSGEAPSRGLQVASRGLGSRGEEFGGHGELGRALPDLSQIYLQISAAASAV